MEQREAAAGECTAQGPRSWAVRVVWGGDSAAAAGVDGGGRGCGQWRLRRWEMKISSNVQLFRRKMFAIREKIHIFAIETWDCVGRRLRACPATDIEYQ